jgi:hypothetical protein
MNLDGAQQKSLRAAKSVISGRGAVYLNTAIHFPSSNTFSWNTPQILWVLSFDCYCLVRLINHKTGIKASMCGHCIFLAAVAYSTGYM